MERRADEGGGGGGGGGDGGGAVERRADWFTTSGAQELKKNSALSYREYLRRSAGCLAPSFEEDLRQIELDLPRTGSSIRQFLLSPRASSEQSGDTEGETDEDDELPAELMAPFLPVLKNILLAFAVRSPRVGYVQGHADVLCFILGNVNSKRDEEEAFWVYASVMERVFPEDFFARSPKLHGFQVDCKLYHELVVRKLVPHFPILAKIDLALVTTLLSCKWFVSLWVGELPVSLLYEVWDTMLRKEDGTILHLLVALLFFRLAVEKITLHMESDHWDSSYIYKIILKQCQSAVEITPQELLQQAQTLYALKDESVEDMRAAIRRLPQLRKAEFSVLARETRFSHLEMERLQDEFTFLRFQGKLNVRSKLRGLRQGELESIVAREFSTWPVGVYDRLYHLLKPDGYGNISFSSLVQLLSTLGRGDAEEKASLLFRIVDRQERQYLDERGIEQLADLLCCMMANQVVADAAVHRRHGERPSDNQESTSDAEKSPLLRDHFRAKLLTLVSSDGRLQYACWVNFAQNDDDVAQLMAWEAVRRRRSSSFRSRVRSLSHRTKLSMQPELGRTPSDSRLSQHCTAKSPQLVAKGSFGSAEKDSRTSQGVQGRDASNTGLEAAPFLKKPSLNRTDSLGDRRQVTLLSKKLRKKFKACWPPAESEALCRNPFEDPRGVPNAGTPYVFWCQCTLS